MEEMNRMNRIQGVNLDGVIDRFTGLLELQRVLFLEFIEARFSEHDLKEILFLLGELKAVMEVKEKHDSSTDQGTIDDV